MRKIEFKVGHFFEKNDVIFEVGGRAGSSTQDLKNQGFSFKIVKISQIRRRGALPGPRGPGGWGAAGDTCHWHLPLALATGARPWHSVRHAAVRARTLPHDS